MSQDRFTSDLNTFVDQALYIAQEPSLPLRKIDFERLVAAVAEYSRQKLLDQMAEQRRADANLPHRL